MSKRFLLLVCFFFSCFVVSAEEVFESPIHNKEILQTYGSGTLSVATVVYSILVYNKDVPMKIEVPQKAFDLLKVGDVIRVRFERGLFSHEIKGISLVRGAQQ